MEQIKTISHPKGGTWKDAAYVHKKTEIPLYKMLKDCEGTVLVLLPNGRYFLEDISG